MPSKVKLLTILTLVSAGFLSAQTARLGGSVVDQTGASIPEATVDVFLPGGAKPILTQKTTGGGLFAFTAVAAGSYDLEITAQGFRKYNARGVVLSVGTETTLPPVKLEVGSTAETVEVTANKLTVQTDNAEITTTVSREQVKALPILNRSPQGFVATQAGSSAARGGDTVINGQRTTFSNVTLDGINIQDNYIRTNAVDFSPNLLLLDQVAEFSISTQNTNPAAGGGSSQVSFVTPSGTNQLHGSVFWSNRNSALAASAWFNNQSGVKKPFLNQNQYGGYVGGPIKKDKLFFYFNYEAFRLAQQSGQQRTILTGDAARGIFTYTNAAGAVQKVNILGAQSIDPTVAALIARIPAPSAANNFNSGDSTASLIRNTEGYLFNQRNNRRRNNITGKVDYILSPTNTITGTYAWNSDLLDRPDVNTVGYTAAPLVQNDDKVNFLSLGWRSNPKANITNEVRFGLNRAPALFTSTEDFSNPILTIPNNASNAVLFSTPVATFRSQGRYTNTYNFSDNAAWVKGAHNVQFGFQGQIDFTEPYNDAGITPAYTLGISTANTNGLTNAQLPGANATDLTNANALLATLVGYVSTDTQTYNVSSQTSGFVKNQTQDRHWTFGNYAGYVQDSWKTFRRLTVNLGIRYDYFSPVHEQNGLVLLPQLIGNNVDTTLLSNATLNFPSNGQLYNADKNNFAPNIGIAYDPFGDGKTSIRAGYSVNFVNDEYLTSATGNANTNTGLAQTVSATGLTSQLRSGFPTITTPAFTVPRTFRDNYNLSPTTSFGMADPNLRTPYVQQWNFGIQREIGGWIIEGRYVGNHGTKLFRALDLNQININAGGFLDDFKRAQQNGNLALAKSGVFNPAYDPTITGSQLLPVFARMPNGGTLTNATNRTFIQQGAVADMAYNYESTKANGPINFFANPFATSLRKMTNYSNSTYNSVQLEGRSRNFHGLFMQANYTFSKALSDAVSGSDNSNQGRYEPLMDNNNPGLAKARALFDITHAFKFNFVYQLPAGKGHLLNFKPLNPIISGWLVSGIFTHQSGFPYSVCSGLGTFNRNANLATNQCNTVNTTLTQSQLNDLMQFRMTGSGPFVSAASVVGTDGRAANAGVTPFSSQTYFIPGAGQIGALQQRSFSGPWDTNFDFGLSKSVKFKERQEFLIRMDSSNFLNHPAFSIGDQTVTSTTFGKVTSTFNSSRRIQFTAQYRF